MADYLLEGYRLLRLGLKPAHHTYQLREINLSITGGDHRLKKIDNTKTDILPKHI